MDQERKQRLNHLLDQALDMSPDQRDAWLAEACGDDSGLRRQVETLLPAEALDTVAFQEGLKASPMLDWEPKDLTGSRVGAWRHERELGHGGMGSVWLASRADGAFTMQAAVKLIKAQKIARPTSKGGQLMSK